ncbi:MAG: transcriptional regulator [Candidatus Bathyarchaeota archaeon]|nr:transcriptional regulator [Candidatus Bathyarchaeota archaeon]
MVKTFTTPGNLELLLVKLIEEVKLTNKKLDSIITQNSPNQKQKTKKNHKNKSTSPLSPDVLSLLSLPAHLRKTVIALYKLEKATAEELSAETKRLRAVESASANQLTRMGYLKKKREGHKVYFYIEQKMEENK